MSCARRALRALAIAVCLLAAPALAQEPPPSDPPRVRERIVVTAGRTEQSLDATATRIGLIDRDEIEASGAIWVRDLLAVTPGATTAATGGPGKAASLFLRGTNSNHSLLLIDGVQVNTPTTGAFDLAGIPTSAIERVEILRGPQSVLYGSAAIGGVVNLITRRPADAVHLSARVGRGSFATDRATLGASGRSGDWFGSFSGQLLDSAGFSAADSGPTAEADALTSRSLSARAGLGRARTRAEILLTLIDDDNDLDGFTFGVGPTDDHDQEQSRQTRNVAARLAHGAGPWDAELTLSNSHQRLETVDPDGFSPFFGFEADLSEADLQVTARPGERDRLVGGVEHRREAAATVSRSVFGDSGFDDRTLTTGAYLEYARDLGASWRATAGGRIESHSRFGDRPTFRASIVGEPVSWARVHASSATGFRAPSLNELYFPTFGNPDLDAESSFGWDAGVELATPGRQLRIDVTYWRTTLERLIDFASSGFVNIGEASTRGVEVEARWNAGAEWRLTAAYTRTHTEEESTGLQLLRRPRDQASLRAFWAPVSALGAAATLAIVGPRQDLDGGSARVELEPYARLDVAGQWALTDGLTIEARIENLTDTEYQEVFGYGTAGRSGAVGLAYRWTAR